MPQRKCVVKLKIGTLKRSIEQIECRQLEEKGLLIEIFHLKTHTTRLSLGLLETKRQRWVQGKLWRGKPYLRLQLGAHKALNYEGTKTKESIVKLGTNGGPSYIQETESLVILICLCDISSNVNWQHKQCMSILSLMETRDIKSDQQPSPSTSNNKECTRTSKRKLN